MADKHERPRIIDNPAVAETYANKVIAAAFDGGSVVITLGASRLELESSAKDKKGNSPPSLHVTARLALPPAAAVELSNALNAILKTLSQIKQKAMGAKPAEATQDEAS